MSRVFADTFYFLALLNPKDAAHDRAVAAALAIQGELVTTAWVLTEFGDAMSAPENRAEFISTLEDLRTNPQVSIIPPDVALFDEGIELFRNRQDKNWSLTDCISFVIMQRDGIAEALTGDKHFEQSRLWRCSSESGTLRVRRIDDWLLRGSYSDLQPLPRPARAFACDLASA